jgi:methylenetetrahydrofolate reductase (NADPH)
MATYPGRVPSLTYRRPAVHTGISARLAEPAPTFSFEFFPPKTDVGEQALWQAIRELEPLQPAFVSVTYGAGGSTRDRTVRVTRRIAEQTTLTPMAHLTCVGSSRDDVVAILRQYADAGIHDILALRGDPPGGPGTPFEAHPDGPATATDLVALIRSVGSFEVGVAAFPEGHPESPDLEHDARVLVAKAQAGASFAISQFFFHAEHYLRLVERVRALGSDLPIVPGIMPVTSVSQIERFAALSGADFPRDLADRLHAVADDPEAVRRIGVEVATALASRLLDEGAPGLHFYTLNRSTATREVFAALTT